jgi:hypothetical protein
MKSIIASIFAVALLGATAATAQVGVGVHVGGVGVGVGIHAHSYHRGYVGHPYNHGAHCWWSNHRRICR